MVRNTLEEKAFLRRAIEQFRSISEVRSFPTIMPEIIYMMLQLKDTEQIFKLDDLNMNLEIDNQQKVLELESALDALRELNIHLIHELEILEAEKNVTKEDQETNRQNAERTIPARAIKKHRERARC